MGRVFHSNVRRSQLQYLDLFVFANELNCCGQLAQAMCTEYGINVEPVCLKTFQSQLQQEFPLL
jgi:hypothetical protein